MAQPGKYAPLLPVDRAFVVQVEAAAAVAQGCFSGRVEHVVSARATHFHSAEELLAFMQQVLMVVCKSMQEET
jgi:hypothetical protein